MIQASADFNNAIKAQVIRARAKLVFLYDSHLTLTGDSIISINVTSQLGTALGGVQDDKVTIRTKLEAFSLDQYSQKVKVQVYFGCLVNGEEYLVLIGTYATNRWQVNDTDKYVEIELISAIGTEDITALLPATNISLKEYIAKACTYLTGETADISDDCLDSTLSQCYLYAKTVKEQFKLFGEAINGIFRCVNGLELTPYKITTASKSIVTGPSDALLSIRKEQDLLDTKPTVEVVRSNFCKSDITSIFSATVNIPAGVDRYRLSVNFGSPSVVSYVQFKKYGYHYTIDTGLWGGTLDLGVLTTSVASKTELTIYGNQIQSIPLSAMEYKTETYITNPYIQNADQVSGLDNSIYTGEKYTLNLKGDPTIQVGDTISVDGVGNLLVTKHNLEFKSYLLSTVGGVMIT